MSQSITEDDLEPGIFDAIIAEAIAEQAEEDDPIPEELSKHAAAEALALRDAVLVALLELVRKEMVEIEDDSMVLVAAELTLAAHEAKGPRHALKKLRGALLDSDNVEEVYAENRALEAVFRRALGG